LPGTRGAPVGLSLYAPAPDAAFYAPELYAPVPRKAPPVAPSDEQPNGRLDGDVDGRPGEPLDDALDRMLGPSVADREPSATGLEAAGDDWYRDAPAIAAAAAAEPIARPLSEPEQHLFEAAVRDLPLYMPENVDVSRWTPRANALIPAAPTPAAGAPSVRDSGAFDARVTDDAIDASLAGDDASPIAWAEVVPSVETDTADWQAGIVAPTAATSVASPASSLGASLGSSLGSSLGASLASSFGAPIGAVPAEGNRRVAAALEEVAQQIRRGALVVDGTVPASLEPQALAAALAAALGALLGVVR
jgi:hypothetical protein